MAEWLALPTSDFEVLDLHYTGGGIQLVTLQHFIA